MQVSKSIQEVMVALMNLSEFSQAFQYGFSLEFRRPCNSIQLSRKSTCNWLVGWLAFYFLIRWVGVSVGRSVNEQSQDIETYTRYKLDLIANGVCFFICDISSSM